MRGTKIKNVVTGTFPLRDFYPLLIRNNAQGRLHSRVWKPARKTHSRLITFHTCPTMCWLYIVQRTALKAHSLHHLFLLTILFLLLLLLFFLNYSLSLSLSISLSVDTDILERERERRATRIIRQWYENFRMKQRASHRIFRIVRRAKYPSEWISHRVEWLS